MFYKTVTMVCKSEKKALGQIPRKHKSICTGEYAPLAIAYRIIHAKLLHREIWAFFLLLNKLLRERVLLVLHKNNLMNGPSLHLAQYPASNCVQGTKGSTWTRRSFIHVAEQQMRPEGKPKPSTFYPKGKRSQVPASLCGFWYCSPQVTDCTFP